MDLWGLRDYFWRHACWLAVTSCAVHVSDLCCAWFINLIVVFVGLWFSFPFHTPLYGESTLCSSISALDSSGFRCVVMGAGDTAVHLLDTVWDLWFTVSSKILSWGRSITDSWCNVPWPEIQGFERQTGAVVSTAAPDGARKGFSLCVFCAFLFGFFLLWPEPDEKLKLLNCHGDFMVVSLSSTQNQIDNQTLTHLSTNFYSQWFLGNYYNFFPK